MSRWPKYLKYYHMSFTIPEELRNFFKRHRKALQELPITASQTLFFCFKKKKLKPWILSVIHTFWAKLNWNPHVHVMCTSGGMTKANLYKSIDFVSYEQIIISWKKGLLRNLRRWCNQNLTWKDLYEELWLINKLYSQKDKDFNEKSRYINFSKKANNFDIVLSYIGRYLKRPIIAQSRIIAYDGKNITFSYKDKYDNTVKTMTVSAIDFIWYLVQHIPNKFFKMINYSWILANRCKNKYLKIINTYYNVTSKMPRIARNFRERIYYFTGKNILKCECWWCFYKYQTIIPWYKPKYFDSS